MASLNLIPNPQVLAVQAAIFLANVVIVKKLFVEPYFSVLDKRAKQTTGSKDEAKRFLTEAEALSKRVNDRLQQAYDLAKVDREKARQNALSKRETLLAAAEKDTRGQIEAVEAQIRNDLVQERTKIPAVVTQLTDEVYRIALA